MRMRTATTILITSLAAFAPLAGAQQAPAPAPSFAPPNLTSTGVRSMASQCSACHGTEGRATPGSTVSSLAGRPKEEIVQLMAQFRSGQRPATLMHQISKGYSESEVEAIANYFSRQSR